MPSSRASPHLDLLTQATYLGGSGDDRAFALAIHPTTGDVFVPGRTTSTTFPPPPGAQPAIGGGQDAFIARLTFDLALTLSIPLSEWAMLAMICLLLMMGVLALRRHRGAH